MFIRKIILICGWPACESFMVIVFAPISRTELSVGSRMELRYTTRTLDFLVAEEVLDRFLASTSMHAEPCRRRQMFSAT